MVLAVSLEAHFAGWSRMQEPWAHKMVLCLAPQDRPELRHQVPAPGHVAGGAAALGPDPPRGVPRHRRAHRTAGKQGAVCQTTGVPQHVGLVDRSDGDGVPEMGTLDNVLFIFCHTMVSQYEHDHALPCFETAAKLRRDAHTIQDPYSAMAKISLLRIQSGIAAALVPPPRAR